MGVLDVGTTDVGYGVRGFAPCDINRTDGTWTTRSVVRESTSV